uniref:Uncharacterized protein n=1 Tax=Hucho hucho TaxID=62062 RepID=A0A4W5KYC7_9TELE
MAAFRRLASIVNRLNVCSAPRNELLGAQTTTGGRTQRCLAVGMCLAAGGAVAFYFYNDRYSQRCRKRMGYSFSGRDLLSCLSAVEAQQKARPFDFEEGDVYMSSHEQRFRLFSSVEYEGQLYMTPQNFIESVTMSEPRNKKPWMSLTKQELEKILVDTPAVWQGTSKLFRNLRERGRD